MLNHFRTLLLNLPYDNSSVEHIPKNFYGLTLPEPLLRIYNILFKDESSRFYKLVLSHNYLNLISAAGFDEYVTAYDNRISYSLNNPDYFKINIVSNPKLSNSAFPIFVNGTLQTTDRDNFHDVYLVKQHEDNLEVAIYSRNKAKYLLGFSYFDNLEDAIIPVSFAGGTSNSCLIGSTGLRFVLGGTNTSFTATSNKTWEFSVESPIKIDINKIYESLVQLKPFNILKIYNNDLESLERLWNNENNIVFKLAIFLLAYIKVINQLWLMSK